MWNNAQPNWLPLVLQSFKTTENQNEIDKRQNEFLVGSK